MSGKQGMVPDSDPVMRLANAHAVLYNSKVGGVLVLTAWQAFWAIIVVQRVPHSENKSLRLTSPSRNNKFTSSVFSCVVCK